jgi:hypothetical protein
VPAAAFFCGFPPSVPLTECWQAEPTEGKARLNARLDEWIDALLTRVIVRPRLTLELVHRLGSARDQAAVAYLAAIGWTETEPDPRSPLPEAPLVSARQEPEPLADPGDALRLWTAMPEPALKGALRLLAAKGRVLPSAIWRLPISEWIFNWRVLLQDDLLDREAERQREWGWN